MYSRKNQDGSLYIFSGPSGVGKTTIMNQLLLDFKNLEKIVPFATRQMRPGEVEGNPYHFISKEKFFEKLKQDKFLQTIKFSGNHYGIAISKKEIHTKLAQGINLMVDLDYTQSLLIKRKVPEAQSIFILPPSLKSLRDRLNNRKDVADVVEKRMSYAKNMIEHSFISDYVIKNQDGRLQTTIEAVKSILNKEFQVSDTLASTQQRNAVNLRDNLKTGAMLWKSFNTNSLSDSRHQSSEQQKIYDKRFGLTIR